MSSTLQTLRQFSFSATVCGKQKNFKFEIPVEQQIVTTNRFCPKEFYVRQFVRQNSPLYDAASYLQGETIDEFEQDCENLASAMCSSQFRNKWDVYRDALFKVIIAHINRFNRLIFNDLLVYMDIFSYFLYADGMSENDIKTLYPCLVNQAVNCFLKYMKDARTLLPLSQTDIVEIVEKLSKENEMKINNKEKISDMDKNIAEQIRDNRMCSILNHVEETLGTDLYAKLILERATINPQLTFSSSVVYLNRNEKLKAKKFQFPMFLLREDEWIYYFIGSFRAQTPECSEVLGVLNSHQNLYWYIDFVCNQLKLPDVLDRQEQGILL